MIPRIKRILYTTDLSDNSAEVFKYAMNSAKRYGAGVIILHVLEPLSPTVNAITRAYLVEEEIKKISDERSAYVKDLINQRLKRFCEDELENDPQCADRVESIQLRKGFPAEVILSMANELNCDLVVMGIHGKGINRNTFLGSTSKRVLRRTRKPVFIIPN